MAHTQDEIQSRNNETQSAAGWDERGVSPPTLEPARLQPPTHPALPRVGAGRLRFAPAPADRNGEPAAPARRLRWTNWVERVFEAGLRGRVDGAGAWLRGGVRLPPALGGRAVRMSNGQRKAPMAAAVGAVPVSLPSFYREDTCRGSPHIWRYRVVMRAT